VIAAIIVALGAVGVFLPEFGLAVLFYWAQYEAIMLGGVKVIYPVFAATLLGFGIQMFRHRHWPTRAELRECIPTALLCGLLLLAVLWSPDRLGGLGKAWKINSFVVMGVVAGAVFVREPRRLAGLLVWTVVLGTAVCALGMFNLMTSGWWGIHGASAFGEYYIQYGRAAAVLMVASIALLIETGGPLPRAGLMVAAAIGFVGLLESIARGQLLAGLAPSVLLLAPALAAKRCRASGALGSMAVAAGIAIFLTMHAVTGVTPQMARRAEAAALAAAGAGRQITDAAGESMRVTAKDVAALVREPGPRQPSRSGKPSQAGPRGRPGPTAPASPNPPRPERTIPQPEAVAHAASPQHAQLPQTHLATPPPQMEKGRPEKAAATAIAAAQPERVAVAAASRPGIGPHIHRAVDSEESPLVGVHKAASIARSGGWPANEGETVDVRKAAAAGDRRALLLRPRETTLIGVHEARAAQGPRRSAATYYYVPGRVGRGVMDQLKQDRSVFGRAVCYVLALQVFRDHLLIGAGTEGYAALTGILYPHNLILEFAAETGLLGLALLAWWAFHIGRRMLWCWPGRQNTRVFAPTGAVAALLLCWFVSSQFSFNINGNRGLFLLAPILAMLCASGPERVRTEGDGAC